MDQEINLKTNNISSVIQNQTNLLSRDIPKKIRKSIQPVLVTNPLPNQICNIVTQAQAANATSATIYTTPTNTDFYLSAVSLSVIKDVTSTSTSSNLTVVVSGTTFSVLRIPEFSLTVQNQSISLTLPFPIKLDRGSAINVTNGTNVANISTVGSIAGFTYDPTVYNNLAD